MSAIDPATVKVGTVMRVWYDNGLGASIYSGIVVAVGPKTCAIMWSNGYVRRTRFAEPKGVEVEILAEPDVSLRRVKLLAAKWRAEHAAVPLPKLRWQARAAGKCGAILGRVGAPITVCDAPRDHEGRCVPMKPSRKSKRNAGP